MRPPEKALLSGTAVHYATALSLGGHATGLLVTTYDGRPTKVEGNPDHPASLGGASSLELASILDLYDPRRAKGFKNFVLQWEDVAEFQHRPDLCRRPYRMVVLRKRISV